MSITEKQDIIIHVKKGSGLKIRSPKQPKDTQRRQEAGELLLRFSY